MIFLHLSNLDSKFFSFSSMFSQVYSSEASSLVFDEKVAYAVSGELVFNHQHASPDEFHDFTGNMSSSNQNSRFSHKK